MSSSLHLLTGTLLLIVGAVLVIAFGDTEFGWFQGRPLGVVLLVLGVVDLGQGISERRKNGPKG